jgi:hypothetical protein
VTAQLEVEHAEIGPALLREVAGLLVFTGTVPTPPDPQPEPPYVLVRTTVAWPRDGAPGQSLAGEQVAIRTTWRCNCVSETDVAALAVLGLVRGALLNVRPTITGRSTGLIGLDEVLEAVRDETLGRPLFTALGIFSFISTA